jgi:hypothetical protein
MILQSGFKDNNDDVEASSDKLKINSLNWTVYGSGGSVKANK